MNAPPLTRRQVVILRYLADGKTEREIAPLVALSYSRTRHDLAAARNSLGARTATQAVATALTRGLLRRQPNER